jgi:hypothetical protein
VTNGTYTFWIYEHCYRLSSNNGTTTGNLIDTIADLIYNNDADVIFSSGTVTHAQQSDGSYISGSAGLFDALNVSRSTTEGLPVNY